MCEGKDVLYLPQCGVTGPNKTNKIARCNGNRSANPSRLYHYRREVPLHVDSTRYRLEVILISLDLGKLISPGNRRIF